MSFFLPPPSLPSLRLVLNRILAEQPTPEVKNFMEQQLQLAESRILFGSENKEGQVRQKPPVSLPGAKFQSLASTCIQEHVPVIQNPPTPAATPVGKKILKRALPGRAGNCSRFKMEIFEIWKEGKFCPLSLPPGEISQLGQSWNTSPENFFSSICMLVRTCFCYPLLYYSEQ